jgi:peptide/nickel transport system permease protein
LTRFWLALFREQPFGTGVTTLLFLLAVLAPVLAPYDPEKLVMRDRLLPISSAHWLGTDEFGRDLLSRVLYGARVAVIVMAISVTISATLGILLGLLAGFYGRTVDFIISRFLDAWLSFPVILLAIALTAIMGPSLTVAVTAIGLVGAPEVARITRSAVLGIRELEYVEAAYSIGATGRSVMLQTILPNAVPPIIVQLSFSAAQAIMWESSLSFLGLGAQPPTASWGTMLSTATSCLYEAPGYAVVVGLAVGISISGLISLGDGLRVVLDPRLSK